MNEKNEKPRGENSITFEIPVKGFSLNQQSGKGQNINARAMFTCTPEREILSIYDPSTKKQINLPFESLEQLITHTRKEWTDKQDGGGGNET